MSILAEKPKKYNSDTLHTVGDESIEKMNVSILFGKLLNFDQFNFEFNWIIYYLGKDKK